MLEFIILRCLELLSIQLTAQELEQMCLAAKIKLEYLPPYSPDYNPIEEAFAELKAWMKKNYLLADGYETFQGFLEAGLKHMNRKPGSHFRSCHIMMYKTLQKVFAQSLFYTL